MSFAFAMVIALAIDAAVGWPASLFHRIGHPVTWIGWVIAFLDQRLNSEKDSDARRRLAGAVTVILVLLMVILPTAAIQAAFPDGWLGTCLLGVLAWPLVAGRSLYTHVADVAQPLTAGDADAARGSVAMIVGRDPALLDEAGIARAALESLAENASDGVVAPLFWGAIGGLPGIAAYKAINTLDSMIGHRTPRHATFGMVAARLDDLVNLLPARLTGLLFAAVSTRPATAAKTMMRDVPSHRSPNAGWPEGAMAGALGIRLSGPRVYDGRATTDPWLNGDSPDPGGVDVQRGLALYARAVVPLGVLLLLAGWIGG